MMYFFSVLLLLSGVVMSNRAVGNTASSATTARQQQQNISVSTNEGLAMKSLRSLVTAESTFQNTIGKGEYGNLKALRDANLIGADLATGVKDGYRFSIVTKKSTLTSAPAFDLVARPVQYGKTDRRSFYVTEAAVLMTSEEKDAPLNSMRPFAKGGGATKSTEAAQNDETNVSNTSEDEAAVDVSANETAIIAALRAIHTAETTFISKAGAGGYGTLEQLEKERLIDSARSAAGQQGYFIDLKVIAARPEAPASFRISAIPQTYGSSGRRSFYIDQTGVLRGADNEGGPALHTDPAIEK